MSLSNKFDSNIYIEPDGSRWVRICHHNNPYTNGIFAHHTDAEWNAGVYGTEHKWFDLGILNDISGTWELMVKQATTSGGTEQKWRWTQNYNPNTTTTWSTAQPGTVTINTSTGYQSSSMGGLYRMNSSARMCIANTSSSNWFGAFGSWTPYGTGKVPAYPNTDIQTGYMDLYVRVDSLLEPLPEKGLRIWLPLTGDLINRGLEQGIEINNTGVTFDSAGKCGQCASFNGSTSRLSLTNLSVGNEWSYGCWVYTNQTSRGWEAIAVLNNNGGDSDNQLGLYIATSTNKFQSTANGQYNSSISFTTNKWSHLFATFDGSTLITYVDGVKVNEKAITNGLLARPNLTIGARSGSTSGGQISANLFFLGKINDFRLYNYTLSAKEVKEISKALVLHYKLDNQYVEGTTNLITTTDCLTSTCYNGATSKYGYGTNTDIYKTTGTFNGKFCTKVYMGTDGLEARPYVYISPLFVSDGTNGPQYRTLSFDYYTNITTNMCMYKLGSGSGTTFWRVTVNGVTNTYSTNGGASGSDSIPITINTWNHIEVTFHGTTSANAEFGYLINGNYNHTSSTSYYWLFANMQIEDKDHATPYVGGPGLTRNTATTEFDCSGYDYDGTYCGTIAMSSNTARYNASLIFNGTDTAIQTPPLSSMITSLEYTIACWTYKTVIGSKGYQTIYGGPSGFELEARNAAGTDPQYVAWNWGKPVAAYTFGEWHHFCFVHRSTGCKIYVDGIEASAGSTANIPTGDYFIGAWKTSVQQNFEGQMSDFRIYATSLSDADVLELYQTSASIDRDGNYYTRELKE